MTAATAEPRPRRAVSLAVAWSFTFAALSCAAAMATLAGLPLGAEMFGRAIADRAQERDAGLAAILWLSGDLKAGCGLVALALLPARGRPLRGVVAATWCIGAGLTAYGAFNVIAAGLMLAGAVATPDEVGTTAVRWHIALWGPWWLAGGALFLLAAAGQRPGPVRRRPST